MGNKVADQIEFLEGLFKNNEDKKNEIIEVIKTLIDYNKLLDGE